MVLALFVSRFRGGGDELAAARYDNTHLRQRITELEAKLAIQTQAQAVQSASATAANCASSTPAAAAGANPSAVAAAAPAASSSGISGGVAATAPASQSFATQLLELHSHWDWKAIAKELLMPFAYVDEAMLDNGVRTCYENGTMYCMRAQVCVPAACCLLPALCCLLPSVCCHMCIEGELRRRRGGEAPYGDALESARVLTNRSALLHSRLTSLHLLSLLSSPTLLLLLCPVSDS